MRPLLDPLPDIFTLGSLNLLAGASGIGKTALMAWMMTRFRDGASLFGHATNPPTAIGYFSADRPWKDTLKWFEKVGYPDVRHYSLVDDHSMSLDGPQLRKRERVKFFQTCADKLDLPPGALLIVDPIALFLGGNLLDYDAVAFACMGIHRYADTRRYCCWGMAHASKQKGDEKARYMRLQDRISGTNALLGFTGTQMYLAPPGETESDFYTFMWNPHNAPAESFELDKDPKTGLFRAVKQRTRPDLTTLPVAVQSVYALFPASPATLSTVDLITLVKDAISRPTLFRHLKVLVDTGHIEQPQRGLWRIAPPGTLPQLSSDTELDESYNS